MFSKNTKRIFNYNIPSIKMAETLTIIFILLYNLQTKIKEGKVTHMPQRRWNLGKENQNPVRTEAQTD